MRWGRPNGGIPPHVTTREAETHVVLQSTCSLLLGTHTYEAGPSAVFFVPRGTPQAFQNVGAGQGCLVLIPPPGRNNEALVIQLAERFGPELSPAQPDPATLDALALAREDGVEPSIVSREWACERVRRD